MTKMIEELEGRESEWKDTPMAARNKLLLKKWKERIKVEEENINVFEHMLCFLLIFLYFFNL